MEIRAAGPESVLLDGLSWVSDARAHARASSMVVAMESGETVGVASCYEGTLHRTRAWLSVDVAPNWRRRGVGTALVGALQYETLVSKRFAAKVDSGSEAAAFVDALGATPYQSCPPSILPVHVRPGLESPSTASGSSLPFEEILEAFVDMYEWVHEGWSPISSRTRAFEIFEPDLRESLDFAVSSFALGDDGRIQAGAWIFRPLSPGGPLDGVAESRRRAVPGAQSSLERAVADTLGRASSQGAEVIAFDSHSSDPHLRTIIDNVHGVTGREILLVELTAASPSL